MNFNLFNMQTGSTMAMITKEHEVHHKVTLRKNHFPQLTFIDFTSRELVPI